MRKPIETLAGGLGHPEGPDILPDGRIVMVETYTSKLIAWSRERGIHDYADCGGGPNACMLGSDGAVYITQNGGTVGAWKAAVMNVPSIQKAWPDGRGGDRRHARGRHRAPGAQRPELRAGRPALLHRPRRLPARTTAGPAASSRSTPMAPASASRSCPPRTPTASWRSRTAASCGWSRTTGASTASGPAGPASRSTSCPTATSPTGSRSTPTATSGSPRSCPAASTSCAPDGSPIDFLETGGVPLNCVFVGADLVITDFGDVTEVTARHPWTGACGGSRWASPGCRCSAARGPAG